VPKIIKVGQRFSELLNSNTGTVFLDTVYSGVDKSLVECLVNYDYNYNLQLQFYVSSEVKNYLSHLPTCLWRALQN